MSQRMNDVDGDARQDMKKSIIVLDLLVEHKTAEGTLAHVIRRLQFRSLAFSYHRLYSRGKDISSQRRRCRHAIALHVERSVRGDINGVAEQNVSDVVFARFNRRRGDHDTMTADTSEQSEQETETGCPWAPAYCNKYRADSVTFTLQ